MFSIGQQVVITINRCACVGGGKTEEIGTIIDITDQWIVVSTPNGTRYAKPTQTRVL